MVSYLQPSLSLPHLAKKTTEDMTRLQFPFEVAVRMHVVILPGWNDSTNPVALVLLSTPLHFASHVFEGQKLPSQHQQLSFNLRQMHCFSKMQGGGPDANLQEKTQEAKKKHCFSMEVAPGNVGFSAFSVAKILKEVVECKLSLHLAWFDRQLSAFQRCGNSLS